MDSLGVRIKRNLPLVIGIGIPVLMIIFVALSIYLPGLFVHPKYDFLYMTSNYYPGPYDTYDYQVTNGTLTQIPVSTTTQGYKPSYKNARFFLHHTESNKSEELTFLQAQAMHLDPSLTSPDGFEVAYGGRDEGVFPLFFAGGSDYNTRYLKGHNASKKLNLQVSDLSYYNFRFLGWITQ